jgi:hypothetical protein
MHQTSRERYVKANKDVWEVRCDRCGLVGHDLDRFEEAEQVEMIHITIFSSPVVERAVAVRID